MYVIVKCVLCNIQSVVLLYPPPPQLEQNMQPDCSLLAITHFLNSESRYPSLSNATHSSVAPAHPQFSKSPISQQLNSCSTFQNFVTSNEFREAEIYPAPVQRRWTRSKTKLIQETNETLELDLGETQHGSDSTFRISIAV